jgi:pimeloyl-ACP methyl ester carboxylesterase
MAQRRGGPVTVIGVSLGGVMARDLALDRPADVRQVITIASPFRLPTAATIEPLFHLVAHRYVDGFDFRRLQGPLPMPSLAIYTREDGIVSWESCVSDEPLGVNVGSGRPAHGDLPVPPGHPRGHRAAGAALTHPTSPARSPVHLTWRASAPFPSRPDPGYRKTAGDRGSLHGSEAG